MFAPEIELSIVAALAELEAPRLPISNRPANRRLYLFMTSPLHVIDVDNYGVRINDTVYHD